MNTIVRRFFGMIAILVIGILGLSGCSNSNGPSDKEVAQNINSEELRIISLVESLGFDNPFVVAITSDERTGYVTNAHVNADYDSCRESFVYEDGQVYSGKVADNQTVSAALFDTMPQFQRCRDNKSADTKPTKDQD